MTASAGLDVLREQATVVEALGYDTIWIPEIVGRDAFVTCAALACATSSVTVATGVVPLPSRTLAAVAMATAALSELAPGRFVLGLGAGHRETASQFGWSRPSTAVEVAKAVESLKVAMRGSSLRVSGDDARAVELKLTGTHVTVAPQVVVGAMGEKMAHLAGKYADGMILNWATLEHVRRVVPIVMEAAGQRPFGVACYIPVCVTDDVRGARAAVRHQLSSYARLRAYGRPLARSGYEDEVHQITQSRGEIVPDTIVDAVALLGDADAVREGLNRYREAGVTEPVLAPLAIGADPASSMLQTWLALAPG